MGQGFPVGKGNVVSKGSYKGIDFFSFTAGFPGNKIVSLVSENWFLISKKSGNCFYFDKWQPSFYSVDKKICSALGINGCPRIGRGNPTIMGEGGLGGGTYC